jgi:hypothetical protein
MVKRIIKRKEDLIGTEWKCPRCSEIQIITIDGIDHMCQDPGWHWWCPTLQRVYEDHLAYKSFRKYQSNLLYGNNS